MGCDQFFTSWLLSRAKEVADRAQQVRRILDYESNALFFSSWGLIFQQFEYHYALAYPPDIKEAATYLGNELWSVFEGVCGFEVPGSDRGLGYECVINNPVPCLQGQSFQHHIVCLPIKRGGLGFRAIEETCEPAFIG